MPEAAYNPEMVATLPPTAPVLEGTTAGLPEKPFVTDEALRARAMDVAMQMQPLHPAKHPADLELRLKQLSLHLEELLRASKTNIASQELTPPLELLESGRMFDAVLIGVKSSLREFNKVPYVRVPGGASPRVLHLAEQYTAAVEGIWSQDTIAVFVGTVQQHDPLLQAEISLLPISLKLAQLEFILNVAGEVFASGGMPSIEDSPFSAPIHSLRRINQFEWHLLLEELVAFHRILAEDPAGAYAAMEEETRTSYRLRVVELAADSNCTESQVADVSLEMAREGQAATNGDSRLRRRRSHVGYYLFDEGFKDLSQRIGYHPPIKERMRATLLRHNENFYILGIYFFSALFIVFIIAPIVPHYDFLAVMISLLLILLPATQGASDLVNNVVMAILPPRALPKLDFSKRIPEESTTLVVVPTLLLDEAQVRETFESLEARYLSNRDPHLHFGLLTDLPDSEERPQLEDRSPVVELAIQITDELNSKYRNDKGGHFFLLHRHRVFNKRQGVWMGWERKRGKLLDLNKLLLGTFDSFPVKAGATYLLSKAQYVITLDSDTQLSRGVAARMIGAMAHPLNQAIVDPRSRIVTAGYGILQPRVGVSVASASRSRLAALFSGETGFDIYTRAISDAYQDLFGEGIFTGKGIYEVSILHQVLDRRFPRDALLSHDLIEGAYARAGLLTDVEIIDDYPSHYSAHTRRRHRWVRGDWQIAQWLFSQVPDESGTFVRNPISTISRWKIFDNLKRSLIEPITFILLVLGWTVLPGGPLYWTIATLALLLVPVFVQLGFNLGRAVLKLSSAHIWEAFRTLFSALGFQVLALTFIPHQMLLSFDAIIRTLVRRLVTGKRLLEWETAAQAEVGRRRSTLDLYLQLCPLLVLFLAGLITSVNSRALAVAAPILLLWALAPAIAGWLDAPPRKTAQPLNVRQRLFLEDQAYYIWKYFKQFGGAGNRWLIPDNVEEKDLYQARKISPTNLGMLLNSRQAALRLGYLTLARFTHQTLETLATYDQLEKHRGHIYNWYDIETLRALPPLTVSTVDSGNLAASLHALQGGALELMKMPFLDAAPFTSFTRTLARAGYRDLPIQRSENGNSDLREAVAELVRWQPTNAMKKNRRGMTDADDIAEQRDAIVTFVSDFAPWLLPKFTPLFNLMEFKDPDNEIIPTLERAVEYMHGMDDRLKKIIASMTAGSPEKDLAKELQSLMPGLIGKIEQLTEEVRRIAAEAERHADAMRFDFLFVESRQLLSIGFDGERGELHSACYDLLASEARIASFLAVASGDIPQRSWFRLDRTHILVRGRVSLLSWTGTMFEYLMPTLWMHSYPNTLITRSLESAVAIQREHVRGIPWGISESGFAKTDQKGRYRYQAWGIPDLALKYGAEDGPVISPYSSFLALPFAREKALANLRRMADDGWVGRYGFYEAMDYTDRKHGTLVKSWMAHHQGMSLLAIANLLCGEIFQRWFHSVPMVKSAELLMHERPLGRERMRNL